MKNIFFCFLSLLFLTAPAHAQFRYGIEAGMNMSSMSVNSTQSPSVSTSALIAYRAGGVLDLRINERIGIQAGLFYSVLGYKYAYGESGSANGGSYDFSYNATVSENFLRLPINIVFRKPLGNGMFFVAVGPFIGYGLNGKIDGKLHSSVTAGGQTQNQDSSFKSTFTFKDDSGAVKAIDYGICASIGYELPVGLFIRAGYEVALSGLSPLSNQGTQTNNCFSISLGFLFEHTSNGRHMLFTDENRYLPKPYNRVAYP